MTHAMRSLRWILVTISLLCLAATVVPSTSSQELHEPNREQVSEEQDVGPQTLHRNRRQLFKKRKFGIFSVFGSFSDLITQTKDDVQYAYRNITKMLTDSVRPDGPMQMIATKPPKKMDYRIYVQNATTTTMSSNDTMSDGSTSNTTVTETSTRPPPYRATSSELINILRRNLKGLQNLFQKEWRKSLDDSRTNIREVGKEFRDALRPILARSTTTTTTTTAAP